MSDRDPAQLFNALSAEFQRYLLEQKAQVERDVLTFPATEGDRLGQALYSRLAEGGFCTLVVTGRRDWDPQSHYFQAARFAARRGCKIQRAFLLPQRQFRYSQSLRDHIALDKSAGIQTDVYYVGELISTLTLPIAESLEFGVWDGVIGCIGVCGSAGLAAGVAEWRVTSRAEDLQTLEDIKALLLRHAPLIIESDSPSVMTDSPDLEEPMLVTAPIAQEMAAVLCRGDHVSPEDCSWYHSVWQYLRIFNMVSTPTWHTQFYLEALREAVGSRSDPRILISGTADYSMLAHVLWALHGIEPRVTVLDLCETPLFLCKWYGKSVGAKIDTIAADLLDYKSEPFDLIATDAFLTRFRPDSRQAVGKKWKELLAPHGSIVTTIRIEPGVSRAAAVLATPDQSDNFRRRALQEARRWQGFLPCPPEKIANLAQRYAERMTSYSFSAESEVRTLFRACGLSARTLRLTQVPGEMASTLYAEVVACHS